MSMERTTGSRSDCDDDDDDDNNTNTKTAAIRAEHSDDE